MRPRRAQAGAGPPARQRRAGPLHRRCSGCPGEGGVARLYRVPSLDPSSWTAEDQLPAVDRIVGADPEQGVVFALDTKRNLVTLDLETRRVRTYLEQVRSATMGPDGALYAVDTGSTVTQMVRRAPIRFRSKLQGVAQGAARDHDRCAARPGRRQGAGARGARLRPGARSPRPCRPSDDRAELLRRPRGGGHRHRRRDLRDPGQAPARSIRLSGHPRDVLFSPSGHRLYVAQDDDKLLVFDRFSGDAARRDRPARPRRSLRGDRFGQWLLVRPATGDTAWVIDIGKGRFAGPVAATWAAGSARRRVAQHAAGPARQGCRRAGPRRRGLSGDRTREGRRRRRVAAGRVAPGAGRPRATCRRTPRRWPAPTAARAGIGLPAGRAARRTRPGPTSWPRSCGRPACPPRCSRRRGATRRTAWCSVPYATREQAEETGRKIGMPSFIVSAQDAPDR